MVREQERRIEELLGPLAGLPERLRQADWAEVDRVQTDLRGLQDMMRMMREVFPVVTAAVNEVGTDGGVGTDEGVGPDGEGE